MNHYILIDDSTLVRRSWEISAKISNKLLSTYTDVRTFLEAGHEKDVEIYLDRNLAGNILGELEALRLSSLGYQDIKLCTTMTTFEMALPAIFELYASKTPPWEVLPPLND